jgi:hypothetical protein
MTQPARLREGREQEAAFLRALETWLDNFSVHIDNKFDSLQVLK